MNTIGPLSFGCAQPAPPSANKSALLIVPEPFVRELIAVNLRAAGCNTLAVQTVDEGKRIAAQVVPDLILIDVDDLPDAEGGWAVELASWFTSKPVVTALLSTKMAEVNGINDAACGATLWVGKPFEPRDLTKKLLRLLHSTKGGLPRTKTKSPLRLANIELERQQPTVRLRRAGRWLSLDLTWTEHRLLHFLLTERERVHSREAIRDAVWPGALHDLRTVDQYVRRLRRSFESVDSSHLITTIKGVGYRVQLDSLESLDAVACSA